MGCGGSKLAADEDTGRIGPIRHRFEEIRRRRFDGTRGRKDSFVSTAGLLHPEEEEDTTAAVTDEEAFGTAPSLHAEATKNAPASPPARAASTMTSPPRQVEADRVRQKQEEEEEEQKKKRGGAGDDEGERQQEKKGVAEEKRPPRGPALVADGRGGRLGHDDEEQPGSPSFRVYFVGSAPDSSDDDSVNSVIANAVGKTNGKKCISERKDSIDSSHSEDSTGKHSKRHKAKRFMTKGPSAVYGLLNVRSCYSVQNSACSQENPSRPCHNSSRHSNASNGNPLLSEKVA